MSEQGKYNTSNALGIATKALNAVGTGNYTGLTNTLTNSLVNKMQGQALKSSNGTVVGYVMTELNNLGYNKSTQSGGNIQTASFAGTLVNAAQTAVKSPVSFAASLAGNYVGSVAGIDTTAAVNNAKASFNNVTTSPNSIVNSLANSIGSALGIGNNDTTDANSNVAPSQQAGTAYNATNYGQTSNSSTGVTSTGTGSASNSTPSDPSYAYTASEYSSTQYQTGSSYTSYNSTERLTTDNSSVRKDVKYEPYESVKKSDYSAANTMTTDEFTRVSNYANSATGYRSLAAFLKHIDDFGVQLQNNFEVEFSGLDGLTLFVISFELNGSKQNTTDIYYDGIKITIPINYEHEHDFSMTLMNDAQGFIYSAIKSYIEFDSYNRQTDPGTTMVIRAFTGQADFSYKGSRIYAKGVRLTSIGGLSYGQSNNEIQTFTVNGTLIEYSHLPYWLSPVY